MLWVGCRARVAKTPNSLEVQKKQFQALITLLSGFVILFLATQEEKEKNQHRHWSYTMLCQSKIYPFVCQMLTK